MSYEIKPLPYIPCAYSGCPTGAIVKVRARTGWAQLCEYHYGQDNLEESKAYCRKHGLDTTEKKIAHIHALLRAPKMPSKDWARKIMENPHASELQREFARPVYDQMVKAGEWRERQPGEDDEPIAQEEFA